MDGSLAILPTDEEGVRPLVIQQEVNDWWCNVELIFMGGLGLSLYGACSWWSKMLYWDWCQYNPSFMCRLSLTI